jgi:ABC-type tungstate transport system permease subunit
MLMGKNSEEAIELFETLSENSQQFSSRGRQGLEGNDVYEVNIWWTSNLYGYHGEKAGYVSESHDYS